MIVTYLDPNRLEKTLANVVCLLDGVLHSAISSGDPRDPILCFSIHPDIDDDGTFVLDIEDFPAVFLQQREGQRNILEKLFVADMRPLFSSYALLCGAVVREPQFFIRPSLFRSPKREMPICSGSGICPISGEPGPPRGHRPSLRGKGEGAQEKE